MSESYLQATQSLRTFPTENHCIWAISYHLKGNSCLLFYFFMSKNAMSFLTNTSPDSDDRYALSVLNSVFGAGAHSKLFNNVREKLSLAYYASSQLEKFKGMMIVNAGIEFENFQKAKDEILVQLEEIKKGNISDFEFDASIKTIVNAYNSYYDDQRALVSLHLSNSVVGTNTEISEYIENISKVTKEDVVRVARKLQLDTVYFLKGKEV